jgi:hypothetical protein
MFLLLKGSQSARLAGASKPPAGFAGADTRNLRKGQIAFAMFKRKRQSPGDPMFLILGYALIL